MENKIVGNSSHRLIDDDPYYSDEVRLNKMFNDYCAKSTHFGGNFWDYMTGSTNNQPNRALSEEELKLVATVIQWLGTPCGKGFLRDAGILQDRITKDAPDPRKSGKHLGESDEKSVVNEARQRLKKSIKEAKKLNRQLRKNTWKPTKFINFLRSKNDR